jgi:hypothetical protein
VPDVTTGLPTQTGWPRRGPAEQNLRQDMEFGASVRFGARRSLRMPGPEPETNDRGGLLRWGEMLRRRWGNASVRYESFGSDPLAILSRSVFLSMPRTSAARVLLPWTAAKTLPMCSASTSAIVR